METQLLQYIKSNDRRKLVTVINAERFTLINKYFIDNLFTYKNSQDFSEKLDLLLRYTANLSNEFNKEIADYKQKERMVRLSDKLNMQKIDEEFGDLFGGDVNKLAASLSGTGLGPYIKKKRPSKRRL